jgi:hypothetical protein
MSGVVRSFGIVYQRKSGNNAETVTPENALSE